MLNNNDENRPLQKTQLTKRKMVLREIFSWIRMIIFSFAIAFFLSFFVIANATIGSGSMENTIMTGDRVMCNRLAYTFSDPERFDIILFEYPYGEEPINYVKRIIGLPGETVEIIDGRVYINGAIKPLNEKFVREVPLGNFGPFEIPEGQYFVLGDNRNSSFDSKSWSIPYISRDTFIGKALFVYYPKVSMLDNAE